MREEIEEGRKLTPKPENDFIHGLKVGLRKPVRDQTDDDFQTYEGETRRILMEKLGLMLGGIINLGSNIGLGSDHIEVLVDPKTGKPIKEAKK